MTTTVTSAAPRKGWADDSSDEEEVEEQEEEEDEEEEEEEDEDEEDDEEDGANDQNTEPKKGVVNDNNNQTATAVKKERDIMQLSRKERKALKAKELDDLDALLQEFTAPPSNTPSLSDEGAATVATATAEETSADPRAEESQPISGDDGTSDKKKKKKPKKKATTGSGEAGGPAGPTPDSSDGVEAEAVPLTVFKAVTEGAEAVASEPGPVDISSVLKTRLKKGGAAGAGKDKGGKANLSEAQKVAEALKAEKAAGGGDKKKDKKKKDKKAYSEMSYYH